MRRLVVVVMALAAGCAHDPATLKTQGDVGLELDSTRAPDAAAACVAQ